MKRKLAVVAIGGVIALWVSQNVVLTLDAYGLDTAIRVLTALAALCGGVGIGLPVRLAEGRSMTVAEKAGLGVGFVAFAITLMSPLMQMVSAESALVSGHRSIYWLTAGSFMCGVSLCLFVPSGRRSETDGT